MQTHLRAMEPTNKKRRARAEALGADLATLVGPDIAAKLTAQKDKRALLIELLPSEHLDLVEVGRVPWEMLRTGGGDLLAHHLAPQIVHGDGRARGLAKGRAPQDDGSRFARARRPGERHRRSGARAAAGGGDVAEPVPRRDRGEAQGRDRHDPVRRHARGGASRCAGRERVRRGAPLRSWRAGRVHPGARGRRRPRSDQRGRADSAAHGGGRCAAARGVPLGVPFGRDGGRRRARARAADARRACRPRREGRRRSRRDGGARRARDAHARSGRAGDRRDALRGGRRLRVRAGAPLPQGA